MTDEENPNVSEPSGQSLLERQAPVALVRFAVDGGDGTRVIDANELALRLLDRSFDALRGRGFVDGLFGDDVVHLDAALAGAPSAAPDGTPVVVRWGQDPPVTTLSVRVQRDRDGTVLAALVDLSEQFRLDTMLCGAGSGVFITDLDRRVTWMSPMTEAVLGIPPESFLGVDLATLVHPDDQPSMLHSMEEIVSHPGAEVIRSYRLRHPLIEDTWWRLRVTSNWMRDDPAIGGIINVIELTIEGSDAEAAVPGQMTLAEMIPSGALMAAGGRVTFRNNRARQMLGSFAELTDQEGWVDALRPTHRQAVRDVLRAAANEGARESTTAAVDRPGDSTLWLRVEGTPAIDAEGQVVGYVATLLDVTTETETREQLQRAQAQLWQLANHDQLTGLANRLQLTERLERALARLRRDHRPAAVLYCDLDRLKPVNDELGHAAGDAVLIEVASRLTAGTRQTDTVCRFGGDEFLIVCEGFTDSSSVLALAKRLIESVSQPIPLGSRILEVGMSVGMAVATSMSTETELLAAADVALYQAKRAGGRQVVIAD